MGGELVKQLNNSTAPIHLAELCTDGDSKMLRGARDAQEKPIKQHTCATHISRTQKNYTYKVGVSEQLTGHKNNKSAFLLKLSRAIVKRC